MALQKVVVQLSPHLHIASSHLPQRVPLNLENASRFTLEAITTSSCFRSSCSTPIGLLSRTSETQMLFWVCTLQRNLEDGMHMWRHTSSGKDSFASAKPDIVIDVVDSAVWFADVKYARFSGSGNSGVCVLIYCSSGVHCWVKRPNGSNVFTELAMPTEIDSLTSVWCAGDAGLFVQGVHETYDSEEAGILSFPNDPTSPPDFASSTHCRGTINLDMFYEITEFDDSVGADYVHLNFRGRVAHTSASSLVGLADCGLFLGTEPSVTAPECRWRLLVELPEEGGCHRRLAHAPGSNRVLILSSKEMQGSLESMRFLQPSLFIEIPPDDATEPIIRKLSSLVAIPTVKHDKKQRFLPLALRETCSGRTGFSTLVFCSDLSIYRIRDEEILHESEAWQPPDWELQGASPPVAFSFAGPPGNNESKDQVIRVALAPLIRYEYFKALLGNFREGDTYSVSVMDCEPSLYKIMLKFVCTGYVDTGLMLGEYAGALRLADKLMMPDLTAMLLLRCRQSLESYSAIGRESQQGIAELLITARALGEDGTMLMQDVIASLLIHRRLILADAEFMHMLTERSPETLRTLMAAWLHCSHLDTGRIRRQHHDRQLFPTTHQQPKLWTARGSDLRPRSRSR